MFSRYPQTIRKKNLWSGHRYMVPFHLFISPITLLINVGDVMHVKVFGQSMVILHSLHAARDLLDKRSSIYSDRPRFVLLSELYVFHSLLFSLSFTVLQNGLEKCFYSPEIVSCHLSFGIKPHKCCLVVPDSESTVVS